MSPPDPAPELDVRERAARVVRSVPLRTKLVAAMLALVAVGLVVVAVAGATVLERYLVGRVDDQLVEFTASVQRQVLQQQTGAFGPRPSGQIQLPSAYYVQLVDAQGAVRGATGEATREPTRLPDLPTLDAAAVAERGGAPFTVSDRAGRDEAWRVVAEPLGSTSTLVTAVSLDDVNSTVGRLTAINAVVGIVVLLLLGASGFLLVRASLRPLVEVERTAEAIARGDLTQRVPAGPPGTEVGRLTNALNGMLTRIESAFRDREHSERAARESEERMRRFVADASHELRTPLTSIRGFAELHRKGGLPDPDQLAAAMRRIEDEATRMGLLVEDLLLLARLDEQRPLDRAPVDLLAVASDAVAAARAIDPERPVSLDTATAAFAPPVVLGDDARLRQVVANLVGNALAHTPPGTPVVVRVGVDQAGRSGFVEVADQGSGLDEVARSRVFERFYRVEPARSRASGSTGGSGLGLSIVAALVAAHGGRVSVESEPGAGARFRVELPLLGPDRGADGPAGDEPPRS